MLTTARDSHVDLIRDIVRSGAREGSFSAELAQPGDGSSTFFAKLRWAISSGRLPQIDPRSHRLIVTRVGGYVYRQSPDGPVVGFGLFRDFYLDGYELWLAGIGDECRGQGLGRAMLSELLETSHGRATQLARCTSAPGARTCSRVLKTLGFSTCRIANDEEWLLHKRTPAPVVEMLSASSMVPYRKDQTRSAHS